jgi:uncharacterized small protein (DUF1192 family)
LTTTLDSKAILTAIHEINGRLDLLTLEMSNMGAFLDTQFKRIAALQAELDLLPAARERRQELRKQIPSLPSSGGNGQSPR